MADKKINCSVYECIHNKSEVCDLQRLSVAGLEAEKSDETYCASFDAGNTQQACMSCQAVDLCDSIDCEVQNCVYNENMQCALDSIKVDYEKGCDDCSTAMNTRCQSFRYE